MSIDKLLKLLKSPVIEDTLIGLRLMVENHTIEEIVKIFNVYGIKEHHGYTCYLANSIIRNIEGSYKGNGTPQSVDDYYLCDNLGFFVGKHITPIEHRIYVDKASKSELVMYIINEL